MICDCEACDPAAPLRAKAAEAQNERLVAGLQDAISLAAHRQAEIDRLRAELADANSLGQAMTVGLGLAAEQRDKAEARLAAVLEVCDELSCGQVHELRRAVRAAATGDTK